MTVSTNSNPCPLCMKECSTFLACQGSKWNCARFMVWNVLGKEHIPDDLTNMDMGRSVEIVRQYLKEAA